VQVVGSHFFFVWWPLICSPDNFDLEDIHLSRCEFLKLSIKLEFLPIDILKSTGLVWKLEDQHSANPTVAPATASQSSSKSQAKTEAR
jgi:hypothetical protein